MLDCIKKLRHRKRPGKQRADHPFRMKISPSAKTLGTSDADQILFDSKCKCKTAIDKKQTVHFPGKRK